MATQTEATVNAIAQDAAPKAGIDFNSVIKIISTWLPVALQCLALMGKTPKSHATDHYDEVSGKYDDSLIQDNRHRMRRAARHNDEHGLSNEQLDILRVAAFDQARLSADSTGAAVMAEASA